MQSRAERFCIVVTIDLHGVRRKKKTKAKGRQETRDLPQGAITPVGDDAGGLPGNDESGQGVGAEQPEVTISSKEHIVFVVVAAVFTLILYLASFLV